MKITVVMPIERYNFLLKQCEPLGPEYAVMANGVIMRDGDQQTTVQFLCDLEQAEKLLNFARQTHPDAASSIEESIHRREP
jgi:hypothetical protein